MNSAAVSPPSLQADANSETAINTLKHVSCRFIVCQSRTVLRFAQWVGSGAVVSGAAKASPSGRADVPTELGDRVG